MSDIQTDQWELSTWKLCCVQLPRVFVPTSPVPLCMPCCLSISHSDSTCLWWIWRRKSSELGGQALVIYIKTTFEILSETWHSSLSPWGSSLRNWGTRHVLRSDSQISLRCLVFLRTPGYYVIPLNGKHSKLLRSALECTQDLGVAFPWERHWRTKESC